MSEFVGLKVWLVLGATLVMYTVVFYKAAVKWKGTRDEVSCVNMSYNMCVTGIGHSTLDLGKSYIRGTSLGWLFFCFLAAEACKFFCFFAISSRHQHARISPSCPHPSADAHATWAACAITPS